MGLKNFILSSTLLGLFSFSSSVVQNTTIFHLQAKIARNITRCHYKIASTTYLKTGIATFCRFFNINVLPQRLICSIFAVKKEGENK